MKGQVLSQRYARALVDLGLQEKSLERFSEELARFSEVLVLEPLLLKILSAKEIEGTKRQKILNDLIIKLMISPVVHNFFKLLMKRGRISLFPEIACAFESQVKMLNHVLVAQVKVASRKEGEKWLGRIQSALEKRTSKKVECQLEEELELIGGFQIRIGDQIYDASVSGELDRLKENWI